MKELEHYKQMAHYHWLLQLTLKHDMKKKCQNKMTQEITDLDNSDDEESDADSIGTDRGPINSEIHEDVFNKHSEMSSFIPANENVQKQNHFITEKLSDEIQHILGKLAIPL